MKKEKLKQLQFLCALLNNTIDDKQFIDVVFDAGKEKYFENASYDTIYRCKKYIDNVIELFPHLQQFVNVFYEKINEYFKRL